MGAVREAIEGAVGEDRVVEEGDPLVHGPIARDNRGGVPIPLDEDVVEIAGLLGGEDPATALFLVQGRSLGRPR
jgi:hypothetical protein